MIIESATAPQAIGTYSQGVVYNDLVFTSGQIAIDPDTNELVSDVFEEQIEQVLKNIEQILIKAGSTKNKIINPLSVLIVVVSYAFTS